MELSIDKPKLPKGLSYPMKSSFLTDVLTLVNFDSFVHLSYYLPQADHTTHCFLIWAEYDLPNQNVDHDRFHIRTGVCPTHKRKELEKILKADVIPQLIDWMQEVKSLPYNSPLKYKREFNAEYRNNQLIINNKTVK